MRIIRHDAKRGFTLIELLVVIAIVGIVASVVLASLNSARRKSRDSRRLADIGQIRSALELYADSNSNLYPTALSALALSNCGGSPCMPAVPTDPVGNTPYEYAATGSGFNCTSYHLGANIEDDGNVALSGDIDDTGLTAVCTGSGPNFSGSDADRCENATADRSCYDIVP
jgi:prepilin-type N-terminal cleavage/methylation domain-containing protein